MFVRVRHLVAIWIGASLLTACGSSQDPIVFVTATSPATSVSATHISAPPVSVPSIVYSNLETRVSLDDGAAITIPPNVGGPNTEITVQRNPAKYNDLPSPGDDFVPIGDFYNFEVTQGKLIGPVDLTMPFDSTLRPDKPAILMAAFYGDQGWEFVPVSEDDGTATVYTSVLGDPVIGWHIINGNLESAREEIAAQREAREWKQTLCDPRIPLSVIPHEGNPVNGFEFQGRVVPGWDRALEVLSEYYQTEFTDLRRDIWTNPFDTGGLPIVVRVQSHERGEYMTFSVVADEYGHFSFRLDPNMLSQGWSWVFAETECDRWYSARVLSRGYAEFKYDPQMPPDVAVIATPTELLPVTDMPTTEAAPIPDGAIPIPDVVGLPLPDALDRLDSLGFGTTWVDASSTLPLNTIFGQVPASGAYYVPRRTTVVLYRTTNQVPTLPPATETPRPTWTQAPTPSVADFRVDNVWITRGLCTTLRWNTVGAHGPVQLNGQIVSDSGSQQVCPTTTTTYRLTVGWDDWTTRDFVITVEVRDPVQVATSAAPTAGFTPPVPVTPSGGGAATVGFAIKIEGGCQSGGFTYNVLVTNTGSAILDSFTANMSGYSTNRSTFFQSQTVCSWQGEVESIAPGQARWAKINGPTPDEGGEYRLELTLCSSGGSCQTQYYHFIYHYDGNHQFLPW